MIGMLSWVPPERGTGGKRTPQLREVLGMGFLEAQVLRGARTPEAILRRRAASAAKRLRRAGATRLVLPEGFPYGAQLERAVVGPTATVPLRQLLAAELARAALARLRPSGGGRLAVAGERLSGELARAVTELALGSRYVLLDVPYGGEALAAQLRREYGVSLLLTADRTQLAEADLLVLFGPRPDLEEGGRAVLRLYDETAPLPALLLPPALEGQLPQSCSRPQLLAALVEGGALRAGQITVGQG